MKKRKIKLKEGWVTLGILVSILILVNLIAIRFVLPEGITGRAISKLNPDIEEVDNLSLEVPVPGSEVKETIVETEEEIPEEQPVEEEEEPEPEEPSIEKIKIASWNLNVFGQAKSENDSIIDIIEDIIERYDIVFIQGIIDENDEAFPELCDRVTDMKCKDSSRAGRSSDKEQYGILYRDDIDISIDDYEDFNPDSEDRWEWPPIKVTFDIAGYELVIYNIHTKPSDADAEINHLEELVGNESDIEEDKIIVLGDLNADCAYYKLEDKADFQNGWDWVIEDSKDTTSTGIDCTYDRIIINDKLGVDYLDRGLYKKDINVNVSEHFLVWVEIDTST